MFALPWCQVPIAARQSVVGPTVTTVDSEIRVHVFSVAVARAEGSVPATMRCTPLAIAACQTIFTMTHRIRTDA